MDSQKISAHWYTANRRGSDRWQDGKEGGGIACIHEKDRMRDR